MLSMKHNENTINVEEICASDIIYAHTRVVFNRLDATSYALWESSDLTSENEPFRNEEIVFGNDTDVNAYIVWENKTFLYEITFCQLYGLKEVRHTRKSNWVWHLKSCCGFSCELTKLSIPTQYVLGFPAPHFIHSSSWLEWFLLYYDRMWVCGGSSEMNCSD